MISVIRIYLLLANSSNETGPGPASQYMQVKKTVPTENFIFFPREQILRDLKQTLQCK